MTGPLTRVALAALFAGVAVGPVLAKDDNTGATRPAATSHAAAPRIAASPPAPPAAASPNGPVRPVLIVMTQHATWVRVSFVLRGNPGPEVRHADGGVELRFAAGTRVEAGASPHSRETGPIDIREADGVTVVMVPLACRCAPDEQNDGGILRLDIRPAAAGQTADVTPAEPGGVETKTPEPAAEAPQRSEPRPVEAKAMEPPAAQTPASSATAAEAPQRSESRPVEAKAMEPPAAQTPASSATAAEAPSAEKIFAEKTGADTTVAEKTGAETTGSETKASETGRVEAKPSEAKPAEPKNAETKVADARPAEPKAAAEQAAPSKHSDPRNDEAKSARQKGIDPKGAGAKRNDPKRDEAEEMARLRETLTAKLAQLNGLTAAKAPVAPPPSPPAPSQGASPGLISDAASSVTHPVSSPEGASPGATSPGVTPPAPVENVQQVPPEPAAAPPLCLAPVDTATWRGPDSFLVRLVALRQQIAASKADAVDVAALAEFYLANGLGNEAMAVAVEALQADAATEDRIRLSRDADIARLVKGEQLSPDSPLLATPPGCQRPDAPLWRALAAAAASDAVGAARDAETVAAFLRTLPEPLGRELAFRVVAAVSDNVDALRAMAGAVRNSTNELPEDEARRFLLQARIAGLTGDRVDYAAFLERAARFGMTVPGVIAKARLAALRASGGGPDAANGEMVLADIARTYRYEALGQNAAEQYAELKLRRHDYAAALAIADESAGPRGARTRESRGASVVVRILRMLFLDPGTAALPGPAERVALFLRYGGYTTPGEKGDDIRLAAARLMLTQRMGHAALDTLQQLSGPAAGTTDVIRVRATAEAYDGDPAKALDLAHTLPDDIASRRIVAEAFRRTNKAVPAAHLLDAAAGFADRARRASLLFEGEAWKDAADAYSALLRDPALPAAKRDDMARRYALAVAMTGTAAAAAPKLPEDAARLLAAVPAAASGATGSPPGLIVLRGALDRARRIETLLDPATASQATAPQATTERGS